MYPCVVISADKKFSAILQTHHFRGLGAARDAKNAQQHSLRHTLLTLASMVLPANLSVLLEALREQ